jgi:hypothetical protein
LGWGIRVVTVPDGLVTRSRNAFASMVVRDDAYTHLLMIDADIAISPESITRLLRSGHDVVGACVPFREVKWSRVRDLLDVVPDASADELESISHQYAVSFEPRGGARLPENGFLPARFVGSAVMLITRDALVRTADSDRVQEIRQGLPAPDGHHSGWTFFDPFVDEMGVYLSEDYAFCHRWRGLGNHVWADIESPTMHVGPVPINGAVATTIGTATRASMARKADSEPAPE